MADTTTTNNAVSLNYGFNWLTGQKLQSYMLQNTGNSNLDYTHVGIWMLGEGEMDGLVEMWDNGLGRLLYLNESADPTTLHFHPGCDAVIGSGQNPVSTGGDQGVDQFWSSLPSGLQPLNYNRWAYYAIKLKQLVNNPPNTHQNDSTVWADVNPIGLWRGLRCRIFDNTGAMTGYAFTRNPAWHFVDLLLRRKLFPEYNITAGMGPDDLPQAVRSRFDWAAIADSAAYFSEIVTSGMPRFTGDYSFSQQTTLQACLTQILTNSRSFFRERSGRYAIVADQPRSSVFTFTRENADNFTVSDEDLHSAGSMYVGKFRDLLVPAFATISSITTPNYGKPVITTMQPHCAVAGDYVVIGNTGTKYDGYWQVDTVPTGSSVYTMTLKSKGNNYPNIGSGGLIGFRYSRFKNRAPQFQHKAMQYAKGAVGVGIPRQRNRQAVTTDFANCTWDQVSRISEYQRGIALGQDATPYITPIKATLRTPLFASDAAGSGAVAIQIEPGDIVTIDDTLDTTYAGVYEVMPTRISLAGSSLSFGSGRNASGGGIGLTLRPYDANNYPDASASSEPGWPDVPVLPGVDLSSTIIPLEDGELVFFTGSASSGDSFQMPDGFSSGNLLCWASPQSYTPVSAHLHFIQDCDAYATRILQLIYNDSDGTTWPGVVNWCAVSWRSNNSVTFPISNGLNMIECTLAGGEKVIFAKGIVSSGTKIQLPAGYSLNQAIILAFPKSASDSGNPAHGVCAYVNSDGTVHHAYQDGEGHHWEGPAQVFIFAWQNNMGTWSVDPSGWAFCSLTDGKWLSVGGFSIYDPDCNGGKPTVYGTPQLTTIPTGGTIPPCPYMTSASIQVMTGPNGFQVIDHPAHGVKNCDVDSSLESSCSFEDGSTNIWYGSSGIFSILCDISSFIRPIPPIVTPDGPRN